MAEKFKIKKGDQVIVVTGRDKGKKGEVLEVLRAESRVRVQGINMVKRHRRATQTDTGGIISMEAPLHISNVAHIDPDSGTATRVGYEEKDGKKVRIARRSGLFYHLLPHNRHVLPCRYQDRYVQHSKCAKALPSK